MPEIPTSFDSGAAEAAWRERWDASGIHRFDPSRPREETFAVDTPPPTVSGSLHVGHVFSFTQTDVIVRYQRMRGRNIAYPMGFDDNGLPTERRVQNVFGIRCDPRLPYRPDWRPRRERGRDEPVEIVSRRNFLEACERLTAEDEAAFEALWRRLGLSVDWSFRYRTIDAHCRRLSQLSFLDLVRKGFVYQAEAPTLWDPDFRTAVAQAEVEDRPREGAFHDLRFAVEGGGEVVISTTRPELLGACVAVVAHPEDARYRTLLGRKARTPLYGAEVPILPAAHADPEKGTGILMVCTFGDQQDIEFWRRERLPLKQLIGADGAIAGVEDFRAGPFRSADPEKAAAAHAALVGLPAARARRRIAELLAQPGSAAAGGGAALAGEPRPIEHSVKFYENGERPLEFLPTRQWFIRLLEHRDALLEQGRRIAWHPPHMLSRYSHWVEGLSQDWCVSRQRYLGVPFPVWYRLDGSGRPDYESPIWADAAALPVDPLADAPPGFREDQRGRPGGFSGDPDVMDTWATSSISPLLVSHWTLDPARHARLFPMDVRPQAHDIIRTWAFYTIAKAWMHERAEPWRHVLVSGWILDPERKKMSKSKGNVQTPDALLDQHTVDGVRYWAARARLGTDTALEPAVMQNGRRLVTKLWNASRFVFGQLDAAGPAALSPAAIREPLDAAFASRLRETIERATAAFDAFDYSAALAATEELFWEFCDDYLELVKLRSYAEQDSPARRSALSTLELAVRTFLRLFAPVLPFVCEEIWSRRFAGEAALRSVHTSPWPAATELAGVAAATHPEAFPAAVEVLRKIRAAKTRAKRGLRWPVESVVIRGSQASREALASVLPDVVRAGVVAQGAARLEEGPPAEGERFAVAVQLAPAEAAAG
jgi:valyl-tRNA synthetase